MLDSRGVRYRAHSFCNICLGAIGRDFGYEKVQSVVMINEGEELAYFWDAFSNFLSLMDKSGNRVKIKNY